VLRSRAATAEAVDFPCVQQVALLRRQLGRHAPETVALVTSLPPEELNAAPWLKANRAAWGIESGLHQRLDVSHLDDQCRVRLPQSMRVIGMFRRFCNSLFFKAAELGKFLNLMAANIAGMEVHLHINIFRVPAQDNFN